MPSESLLRAVTTMGKVQSILSGEPLVLTSDDIDAILNNLKVRREQDPWRPSEEHIRNYLYAVCESHKRLAGSTRLELVNNED